MNDAQKELQELKKGEQKAWENLVEQTSPRLFALFGSILGLPNQQARELVSDVYVRAYKNISGFRGDAKITTWLSVIATNIARDYIKRRIKDDKHISIDDVGGLHGNTNDEDEIDRKRENRKIYELLPQLPESHRRVLIMHYIEGKKYKRIADVMNIPMGTVKTLIYRGKKMLRDKYMEKYGEMEL